MADEQQITVPSAMGMFELDPTRIRDISPEALGPDGRLLVLPASYWATTTVEERALFGHRHGLYSFPTIELVEHLKELIGDRKAIEIGAGHGVLAEALGIPATDSKQQEMPEYREHYRRIGQPPVPYGPNVMKCDGNDAVRQHKPKVVISCWVTHKYDVRRHSAGGNEVGVKEEKILERCETYVVVGNERIHSGKSIWKQPHTITHPDWLYSRAQNGSPDFIAIWSKS